MPKIFEYLGISVFFYSNEHEPVHVHGRYASTESKAEILIVDGAVLKILIKKVKNREPLKGSKLTEFKKLVEIHVDYIVKCWIDYFVYNKKLSCLKIAGRLKDEK